MVQLCKLLPSCPGSPAHPRLLPFFISLNPQRQTVVLHTVDLFIRKSAQPGTQIAEHTLVCKVLFCHGQQTSDIFYERI